MWHSTYSRAKKAELRKGFSCLYTRHFLSRESVRLLFLARNTEFAKLPQQTELFQRSQEHREQRKLRRVSVALKSQATVVSTPHYQTAHEVHRASETTQSKAAGQSSHFQTPPTALHPQGDI